ncbi:MAG: hypothetical protein H7A24_13265 [Leptospiraceae bacterium]|nr:hypothetical protein [Leptospiraceae bacterium]MCP5512847.1 hypothetical protein [Leptospiraceae bacterium]
MQNIDFSKRIKKDPKKFPSNPPIQRKKTEDFSHSSSGRESSTRSQFLNILQQRNQQFPVLYLFIGAILFFTSGLVVGMKIDQKESYFSSNEINTFKNIGSTETEKSGTEISLNGSDDEDAEESKPTKQKRQAPPVSRSIPKNIQFPPKPDQINYIIQLGNFSKEEATKLAVSIIREKQEFQGRIFRTQTGKLYAGYYYNHREAKAVLKKVKKFRNGVFKDASIKNIQF